MRLRNNTILPNLKRKAMAPVLYQRIDDDNSRVGTKWFKFQRIWFQYTLKPVEGVLIFEDGAKRFISNSWYLDEEIERL